MGECDYTKQYSLDKALVEACDNGNIRAAVAALDTGANPDAANTWSDLAHMQGTARMRASKHGYIDIARVLCDRGADVNVSNGLQNETALYKAAFHGHVDVVQLLAERQARLDAPTKYGRTALHVAAGNLRFDVVQFLINAGADINAKDRLGFTPLDCAMPYRPNSVARLLKEHGATATISLADEHTEVDKSALTRQLSFEEAASKYKGWNDILSKYRDGDEFWEYSSDNESWQLGMGQAGLVLLRNNRYVDGIVTEMN